MPIIGIVRSEWSGTSGGPGLSQHAVMGAAGGDWNPTGAQSAVNAVRAFWAALASNLPDEVRIQVSPVVDTYNRDDGELFSSNTAGTVPGVVAGTSTSGYAGGAGVKVTWNTNQIRNGRRVRGATFIVPISGAIWTANGNIGTVAATTFNNAAAQLISSLGFRGNAAGGMVPAPSSHGDEAGAPGLRHRGHIGQRWHEIGHSPGTSRLSVFSRFSGIY